VDCGEEISGGFVVAGGDGAVLLELAEEVLPWYLATLANHHGEFLAGVLAFMMRDKIARFGFLLPFAIGAVLLGYFLTLSTPTWYPIALFFLICAFVNLNPSEPSWWQSLGGRNLRRNLATLPIQST